MKKKNRKAAGKQQPRHLDEERDFKIKALKAERRNKYSSKNHRPHHIIETDDDWEADLESLYRD